MVGVRGMTGFVDGGSVGEAFYPVRGCEDCLPVLVVPARLVRPSCHVLCSLDGVLRVDRRSVRERAVRSVSYSKGVFYVALLPQKHNIR